MEPQEYIQLIERLLEDATQRKNVLAQAAEAEHKEVEQIQASGHIPDEQPNAQPVYGVQEELASWEKIVRALTDIQTELHRIK